jgi:hypothetical protein
MATVPRHGNFKTLVQQPDQPQTDLRHIGDQEQDKGQDPDKG